MERNGYCRELRSAILSVKRYAMFSKRFIRAIELFEDEIGLNDFERPIETRRHSLKLKTLEREVADANRNSAATAGSPDKVGTGFDT